MHTNENEEHDSHIIHRTSFNSACNRSAFSIASCPLSTTSVDEGATLLFDGGDGGVVDKDAVSIRGDVVLFAANTRRESRTGGRVVVGDGMGWLLQAIADACLSTEIDGVRNMLRGDTVVV